MQKSRLFYLKKIWFSSFMFWKFRRLDLVAHLKIFQMFLISGHVALLRNCFRSVIERPLKDDRGHIYTTHSVKEGRDTECNTARRNSEGNKKDFLYASDTTRKLVFQILCFHIRYLQYFQHHFTFSETTNIRSKKRWWSGRMGGLVVAVKWNVFGSVKLIFR